MDREIKGKFVNGKVELLEEVNWEEGQEVKVVRMGLAKKESVVSTAGAWKDDSEFWEEFTIKLYEERRKGIQFEQDHTEV